MTAPQPFWLLLVSTAWASVAVASSSTRTSSLTTDLAHIKRQGSPTTYFSILTTEPPNDGYSIGMGQNGTGGNYCTYYPFPRCLSLKAAMPKQELTSCQTGRPVETCPLPRIRAMQAVVRTICIRDAPAKPCGVSTVAGSHGTYALLRGALRAEPEY